MVIKTLRIQSLAFVQVHYRTVVQYDLDCLKSELAKYWMEVMEAQMGHINLNLVALLFTGLPVVPVETFLIELLLDLKEALFDLLLHFWFQLLLHVMHL